MPGPRCSIPGAVLDPDTGALISDAEVAEVPEFTAFGSTDQPVTARLIVRRVRDRARLEELFPVWRHHPFLTNSLEPAPAADITHRRHAIIETTFADLIDGPLAHLPSGRFAANSAWAICAAITHNLLRAAGTLASHAHAVARGATLRRDLIPCPPGPPARKAAGCCTCPRTGPGPTRGPRSGTPCSPPGHPATSLTPTIAGTRPDPEPSTVEKLGRPAAPTCPTPTTMINFARQRHQPCQTQADPRIEA